MNCPCNTAKPYQECCGPYHSKEKSPNTPEALMRSRYTAYVKGDMDYIQRTMRGPAVMKFNEKNKKTEIDIPVEWLGLEVVTAYYGSDPNVGYVEFIARYKHGNKENRMHELSEFHYEDEHWYYVDGEHLP